MMGREHIRNISLLSDTKISGIFEPNLEMRKLASQLAPEAIFCETLEDLILNVPIDCLIIATPNFCHIQDLCKIANIKQMPLLIEKPIVTNLQDIRKLRDFQKTYSSQIWVAMEYRFIPALQDFIKNIHRTTGGVKMLSIREHRYPFLQKVDNWNRFNKYSGGTFVEKCCHFFDLMRLISASDPIQIMASGGQDFNHLDEYYDGEKSDIWDNGYVIVDFENGSRAMLELCMFADVSTFQEEISAVGNKGKIECKLIGPKRFWDISGIEQPVSSIIKNDRKSRTITTSHIPVDPILLEAGDHNGSTFFQHMEFQKMLLGERSVEVSVEDGVWAVRMGLAAQRSVLEKRFIKMSEIV